MLSSPSPLFLIRNIVLIILTILILTVEEVAQRFNVPRTWVYAAVRGRTRRKLPHIRIGRYIRFEEIAVRLFIESNKQAYPANSRNR